jgi:2-dehydro-3-deoxygalactonokinase
VPPPSPSSASGGTFLSCDWGTTTLRLRVAEGRPPTAAAEVRLDEGAARIHALLVEDPSGPSREERFEGVLRRACGELARAAGSAFPRHAPIVISGMAGSSIGWREVPYAETPFPLDGSGACLERVASITHQAGRHEAMIIGGLRTAGDVMRGEETEVLGLLSDPDFVRLRDGCLLVLPGTHSKHVHIDKGSIRSFSTYMTGELFALLQEVGILRHSVARAPAGEGASRVLEDPALADALRLGARHSSTRALSGALFQVRVNSLLGGMDAARNLWFLSGVLMGAEVADALERPHPSLPIALAGGKALSRPYSIVFEALAGANCVLVARPEAVESVAMRGQAIVLDAIAMAPEAA